MPEPGPLTAALLRITGEELRTSLDSGVRTLGTLYLAVADISERQEKQAAAIAEIQSNLKIISAFA